MEKTYDPAQVEAKWYARWTERGLFGGDAARGGEPYCVVIPPPNVTGILHMGHALNNTIQDILVRWRRMQGRNVVWMPGTDHAGIATQNVVEKALRKEGKTRQDLGRDAFIERVWSWKEQYGSTIIAQLKKLGCSCDWPRERFTMDEGLSRAVTEVFVRLYERGLIYRANYIINWCPRCHTALSDEESEHKDTRGRLYHIRYPVENPADGEPAFVTVATTRPETLLGDVAVAVNPKDERYLALQGRTLRLPVLNRRIPVIADDFVDPAFGTGAVKVTPAHDPNDFQMGLRHTLAPINVMHGDGRMNEEAGPYAGQDRFACRKQIVQDLEAAGLLDRIEEHQHAVGQCYRCDTVVEPRLSPQWFVRMQPLAEPALAAVRDGRVRFVPGRWNKVYTEWMENIRDWCISRQIWWGHRIPVYYCDACNHQWAARQTPDACPKCGAGGVRQDEDVLDTWFSSWLWPFSTFGWPDAHPDLKFYYPTHDLVTASEIIFFWVARMVMAGCEFMGAPPFSTVYIHGTVRDDRGRKMSKSLGNSIDPLDIIKLFSADALRFSLTMLTATGQDVQVSNEKFEIGRNFGTKLWNAARFMRPHLPEGRLDPARPQLDPARLSNDDRHLLARLAQAIRDCEENLDKYRFNDAAHTLYEFVWHQYCDWYLEYAKEALYGADTARKEQVLRVMTYVFATSLKLLHPFMPFITEELWHAMGYGGDDEFLIVSAWPAAPDAACLAGWGATAEVVTYVDDKHDLIRAGRQLKSDCGVAPAVKARYAIKPHDEAAAARLAADRAGLEALLRAEAVTLAPQLVVRQGVPSVVTRLGTLVMPIEGLVDVAAERARQQGELDKIEGELARVAVKLDNPDFMTKAKPEVIARQQARKAELFEQGGRVRRLLEALAGL